MSNKKISELQDASYIDYEKDYILTARGDLNCRLRLGYIIEESIAALPTKLSQFKNDVGFLSEIPSEYITETELALKRYLTEEKALADYAKRSDVPDKVSELENDREYVTEDELTIKDFATRAFVKAEILSAQLEFEGPEVDLNDYTTVKYVDEQIKNIELTPGPEGPQGPAFTYDMFTAEQLESLKGPKGDKGDTGIQGEPGKDGSDYILTEDDKQEIASMVITNDSYYNKTEIDNKINNIKTTTAISVNGRTYNQNNGTITIPDYPDMTELINLVIQLQERVSILEGNDNIPEEPTPEEPTFENI